MNTREEMRQFAAETVGNNENIIIMFSGEGTTLQSFVDNSWCANIVGAVTDNPNAGGIARCLKANIPVLTLPRQKGSSKYDHEVTILSHLNVMIANAGGIKYIVLAGYMRILSLGFIKHPVKPLTQRQKRIEERLGAYQLEAAFYASPDPSQVRDELRKAILSARRAAALMDEMGCPWFDELDK